MNAPNRKKTVDGGLRAQILISILLGIILLFADTYLEQYAHNNQVETLSSQGKGEGQSAKWMDDEALHFWSRLLEAGGIAAVIFGMFTLFLELPGLRSYFLERMRELVIEKPYLKNLSDEELKDIQFRVHQAHFRNDDIADDGSFLQFLYRDIYSYIGDPYRERVTLEIRYEQEGEDLFVARDRLTYICRMSRGTIINAITWQNDPGEVEEIRELQVEVRYPQDHATRGEKVTIGKLENGKYLVRDKSGKMTPLSPGDGAGSDDQLPVIGKELRIKLHESYENIDHMKVIIDAVYTVRASHFLYWLMSYPTKDFSLTLKFPDSHIVQAATFINNEHVGVLNQERGYYSFSYNSWMIPQSGVAWRFLPGEANEPMAPALAGGPTRPGL
jgi:hypothetical protein